MVGDYLEAELDQPGGRGWLVDLGERRRPVVGRELVEPSVVERLLAVGDAELSVADEGECETLAACLAGTSAAASLAWP